MYAYTHTSKYYLYFLALPLSSLSLSQPPPPPSLSSRSLSSVISASSRLMWVPLGKGLENPLFVLILTVILLDTYLEVRTTTKKRKKRHDSIHSHRVFLAMNARCPFTGSLFAIRLNEARGTSVRGGVSLNKPNPFHSPSQITPFPSRVPKL